MENSIRLLFWLYKSKKNSKGLAPVFLRLTVAGNRTEISTGINVPLLAWNSRKGQIKGITDDAKQMNQKLAFIKNKIQKIYDELVEMDLPISTEQIKTRYTQKGIHAKTLLEAFNYHNNRIREKIGVETSKATYTKYETLLKKMTSFIADKMQRRDVFLKELNHHFIVEFETYLKVTQKISQNPTMKYIQFLKKIIHLSVANGWITHDPFKNFKCTLIVKDRGYLTQQEVNCIISKAINIKRLNIVRDLFVLCCYTGLSYVDLKKLTHTDVTEKDGGRWIIINRTKTGIRSAIPLLPQALNVLNKYEAPFTPDNNEPLLPVLTNQKMNAYLKEIADICGITKNLTMHLARHTFATTVTLTNGVPIETVSKMLGHTNLKTTQHYSKVVDSKVQFDMQQLQGKICK